MYNQIYRSNYSSFSIYIYIYIDLFYLYTFYFDFGGVYTILRFLIGVHLNRLTHTEIAKSEENKITAWRPINFRSSASGSAAHDKKVTTSFAIWDVVAGVPIDRKKDDIKKLVIKNYQEKIENMATNNTYHQGIQLAHQTIHVP